MIDHAILWLTGIISAAAGWVAGLAYLKIGPFKPQEQPELPVTSDPMPVPTPPATATPAITASERVYQVAKDNIGKHLSLNEKVSPEVGCAEAWSWVMKNAGYDIPQGGIPTVLGAIDWMLSHGFKPVQTPTPGCIITGSGNPAYAHIGVVMQHGICSNTSANGLWQENYSSIALWKSIFAKHGSTTRFFEPS